MHYTCGARTDVGLVRPGNEDHFLVLAERGLFIVADGMGGHAAGELASEMAVRITCNAMGALGGLSAEDVCVRMRMAMQAANEAVFERTESEWDKRGMGTTATVLVLLEDGYVIGQVGDSRAYLFRRGSLLQLTRDHSYVQELMDAGLITPAQARTHRYSRAITRYIGEGREVVPDIYAGALEPDDVLLLASDGLTEMVEEEELVRILCSEGEPQRCVDQLIAEANARGGVDNITAVVVRALVQDR
ncbi:MAG TPA: Stp1/IreP family PP2C-type Ser/Thr phosphatase [Gemmatimonadales bacterium]|nr:Stp1/IreP family PP2C-type Ser/Thr phosphatase [Gemmatimonadales bacterium]